MDPVRRGVASPAQVGMAARPGRLLRRLRRWLAYRPERRYMRGGAGGAGGGGGASPEPAQASLS
jgi:hypothetical protein